MKVQLLHTADCHVWQKAEFELEKALKVASLPVAHEIILIENSKQAEDFKFSGSPQISIDGIDIDPKAAKIKIFSVEACRPYFWQGKSFDYPPKEMILSALKTHQK